MAELAPFCPPSATAPSLRILKGFQVPSLYEPLCGVVRAIAGGGADHPLSGLSAKPLRARDRWPPWRARALSSRRFRAGPGADCHSNFPGWREYEIILLPPLARSASMAAMKPRTGDGPMEVTKENRSLVMRVPLEGGGRLVVELNADEANRLSECLSAAVALVKK